MVETIRRRSDIEQSERLTRIETIVTQMADDLHRWTLLQEKVSEQGYSIMKLSDEVEEMSKELHANIMKTDNMHHNMNIAVASLSAAFSTYIALVHGAKDLIISWITK